MNLPTPLAAGIALLSLSLMATELVLTRIFSVIVWYHFAFFAISVALFGTGAAAVVLQLRARRSGDESATLASLSLTASVLSFTIAVVDVVLVRVTPDWFAGESAFTSLTGKLLFTFLLAAAPFFVGGLGLALAMTEYAVAARRLYFWDLGGAALACVLVVPLLTTFGGPGALMFAGTLAALSALAFAASIAGSRRRLWLGLGAFAALTTASLALAGPGLGFLRVRVAKGIDLEKMKPEFERWNAFSTVTVLPEVGFRGWGFSPVYREPLPPQKTLVIDMNAMTTLTRFDGSLSSVRHSLHDLSALVWGIREPGSRACVIGAGGGKDVLAALAGGASHVTAVEINPLIVDGVMRGRFRDFVGDLYGRPDVSVHVADGRTFVRASQERFDVILLSMVDTSAATAAGAYALTENSLYTTDALRDFLDKLRPGGILSVSTASLEGLATGARLSTMAREVLRERGASVARSVAIADTAWLAGGGTVLHDVLLKPSGFTDAEAETFERLTRERGFVPVHVPGRPVPAVGLEQAAIQVILTATDEAELQVRLAALPLDVTPVDDERPFFFYQNRLADLPRALVATDTSHLFGNGLVILAKVVAVALLVTALFFGLPLLVARRALRSGTGAASVDAAYVACLGLGFMFVEIGAIQRLSTYLGQPTYTLAVVLFVLLLAGATGSRLSARLADDALRRALPKVLLFIAAYAVALALVARTITHATASLPTEGRALVAAALLVPVGLAMGVPFPAGLTVVGGRAGARVPWLFAINSATSVLGSVLATLVALHAGIPAVLVVGAVLYCAAALCWMKVGLTVRVP